jgi:hypothetical protein
MKNKKTPITAKKISRPKTTKFPWLLARFIFTIGSNSLMGHNPLSSNAPSALRAGGIIFRSIPTYRMGERLSLATNLINKKALATVLGVIKQSQCQTVT